MSRQKGSQTSGKKSRQKKNSYQEYEHDLQLKGEKMTREQEAARREQDFVNWIHDLGATLRQVRHASTLSEKELAARLNGGSYNLVHLDSGFSDRVQIGDIKMFIDACEGSLAITVRDKQGKLVSERSLAGASASASESAVQSGVLDTAQVETLASLVVTKLIERLTIALSGAGAGHMKQADFPTPYLDNREETQPGTLHEPGPLPWGDADKPSGSDPPRE